MLISIFFLSILDVCNNLLCVVSPLGHNNISTSVATKSRKNLKWIRSVEIKARVKLYVFNTHLLHIRCLWCMTIIFRNNDFLLLIIALQITRTTNFRMLSKSRNENKIRNNAPICIFIVFDCDECVFVSSF